MENKFFLENNLEENALYKALFTLKFDNDDLNSSFIYAGSPYIADLINRLYLRREKSQSKLLPNNMFVVDRIKSFIDNSDNWGRLDVQIKRDLIINFSAPFSIEEPTIQELLSYKSV
jgi:hypothetical protein